MASPARFTFDLNLKNPASRPVAVPQPAGIPEDLVAQLIADARAEAYAEGRVAGAQDAASMAAQTIASAAATLATQVAELTRVYDDASADQHQTTIELAAGIGRKLALHLVARHPTAELEALIAECLPSLTGVPHLVIRCNPDLADAIRDSASAMIASSGYAGRLVVMGDPDIRLGDGRLEWVDGGLVRDIAEISRQVDRQIATYLAARSRPPREEE